MDRNILLTALEALVGPRAVLHRPEDVRLYEYDGSLDRATPDFVVLPRTTAEVIAIVKLANQAGMPFMPRGAGTGLSGGVVPVDGGIVISLSRMKEIISIDLENRVAVVQPGVVNIEISEAVASDGFYYVPDPSSQRACTIGGNVAENSGGPHCLAYGVTANHVLGLEIVTPEGDVLRLGGIAPDAPGSELIGLIVGSEGTLGIVTEITVRLEPRPEQVATLLAVFDDMEQASETVSAIIAAGDIPAALEMMDTLAIQAVEAAKKCGYPTDAAAVLLIDVEGLKDGLEASIETIAALCHEHGAREVRRPQSAAEREKLWSGRKGAFGAMGRISPSYYVQDGVIPRTKLPMVLRQIGVISQEYGFRIANVFHAGDGNLHPLILFDERDPEQVQRVVAAGSAILQACVDAGGSISGEHGIGLEKRDDMPKFFTAEDLIVQRAIRDALNPRGNCNPAKVLPIAKACYEVGAKHRRLPT